MSTSDAEQQWCALLDVARRLLDEHDLAGARLVLREAMTHCDTTWGKDDAHLIRPLRLMAESLWREHDPVDPHNAPEIGCLEQALAIARRRLPPNHLEVGRLASELGSHLVIAGRLDEGCALMLEGVEIADKNASEDFERYVQIIAQVRIDQGRPTEALPLIERVALAHNRRGPSSVPHAIARYHLGRCLHAVGRHRDALDQLHQALAILDAKRVHGSHAASMNEIIDLMDRIQSEIQEGDRTGVDDGALEK